MQSAVQATCRQRNVIVLLLTDDATQRNRAVGGDPPEGQLLQFCVSQTCEDTVARAHDKFG